MPGDEGGEEDIEVDSGEETIGKESEGSPSVGVKGGVSASDRAVGTSNGTKSKWGANGSSREEIRGEGEETS